MLLLLLIWLPILVLWLSA